MTQITVRNWEKFQHADVTKHGRAPAWIKNYTRLLSDENYLGLSGHDRAVLHGLWLECARSGAQLPLDTRSLTRRLHLRVTTATLTRLNHAGFLDFRQDAVTPASSLEEKREEKTVEEAKHTTPLADFLTPPTRLELNGQPLTQTALLHHAAGQPP